MVPFHPCFLQFQRWFIQLETQWREQRVGKGLLQPFYIALGARWITWFVACGIIVLRAADARNLDLGYPLLLATALQLTAMTCYLSVLRANFPRISRWLESSPWLLILDVSWSLLVVHLSGGWGSPFYQFALNSVLGPSLKYRLRGAAMASVGFSFSYLLVLLITPPGYRAFFTPDGRLQTAAISAPINPFMVAFFAAMLAEVLDRLKKEKIKVTELAAQDARHRLNRELHDGVAQTLYMLHLSLDACCEHARRQNFQRVSDKLPGMLMVSRQALWEVRNSLFDPETLWGRESSVCEAVSQLVREYEAVVQTPVTLLFEGVEHELCLNHRVALYRILQESLANAFKHAQANAIFVRLCFDDHETSLLVLDDGKGFEMSSVLKGRGLHNLRSRALEVGGKLELDSTPGEGTNVILSIPRSSEKNSC